MKRLIVYARQECHLCEEMIASLRSMQQDYFFELKITNIDLDQKLIKLYSDRVPVLFAVDGNRELCHYYLDWAAVSRYLAEG